MPAHAKTLLPVKVTAQAAAFFAQQRLDFANPNATQTCGCGESFGIS